MTLGIAMVGVFMVVAFSLGFILRRYLGVREKKVREVTDILGANQRGAQTLGAQTGQTQTPGVVVTRIRRRSLSH